jgi:hypothetical protein
LVRRGLLLPRDEPRVVRRCLDAGAHTVHACSPWVDSLSVHLQLVASSRHIDP